MCVCCAQNQKIDSPHKDITKELSSIPFLPSDVIEDHLCESASDLE